jgi:hypothetical protein
VNGKTRPISAALRRCHRDEKSIHPFSTPFSQPWIVAKGTFNQIAILRIDEPFFRSLSAFGFSLSRIDSNGFRWILGRPSFRHLASWPSLDRSDLPALAGPEPEW